MIKKLLKEPLLHFLVLGALVFAASIFWGTASQQEDANKIVVSATQLEQLHTIGVNHFRREPTQSESQQLLNDYIKEQVLFREGLRLGVVDQDASIRKRVAEHVLFLLSDAAMVKEPTDAELQAYMSTHQDLFAQPALRSFTHVFYDAKTRSHAEQDAQQQLTQLLNAKEGVIAPQADLFVSGNEYQGVAQTKINEDFGETFASALFSAPLNVWQGPVTSKQGVHLFKVTETVEAKPPVFSELRERISHTYIDEQQRLRNAAALEQLMKNYRVEIESASSATTSSAAKAP